MQEFDYMRLVYLLGVLVLIWPGVAYFRRNATRSMQQIMLWIALGLTVAILYLTFRGL